MTVTSGRKWLRIIKQIKPVWVVAENVPGIINMELDSCLASLENQGYTTGTLVIPACGVGAPHRRNRLFIIGNTNRTDATGGRRTVEAYFDLAERETTQDFKTRNGWINELVARNVAQRANSYAHALRVLDGIPARVDRLKALGNAIVPQIAEEIGRIIIEVDKCANVLAVTK